jgi:hypothetical protein
VSCSLRRLTSTESANISITDNTVGSIREIGLTGTGTTTSAHSVVVGWIASTSSSLVGDNVYRGTTTGGPYSLLTPTPITINADYVSWTASVTIGVTGYNVYRAMPRDDYFHRVQLRRYVRQDQQCAYYDDELHGHDDDDGRGLGILRDFLLPDVHAGRESGFEPIAVPGYTDTTVTHGTQYFYVVTSVGMNPPYSPVESLNSTEVSATP